MGIRLLMALLVMPLFACSSGVDAEPKPAGPDLGTGHEYQGDTLARFRKLMERDSWSVALPPRNPRGMLEAVHGPTGLTLVLIPEGEFMMGSSKGEDGRLGDEDLHPVTIGKPFLFCETECTQGAWEKGGGMNDSKFKGADRPVEQVSWTDCHDWCRRNGLRLPSESEWEFACRAGTRTRYSWGNDWDPSKCMAENDEGSSEDKGVEYYRNRGLPVDATAPVRQFPANPWGLHDMHGNVWEWCEDWSVQRYSDAPSDGSAHTTQGGSSLRVYRGGSWNSVAWRCRSAFRLAGNPSGRYFVHGFRPVADLPE